MTRDSFEGDVAAMLRRRAADIDIDPPKDQPRSAASFPSPARQPRSRMTLAVAASVAVAVSVLGVVMATSGTPSIETVTSATELVVTQTAVPQSAATQPNPASTATSIPQDRESSAAGLLASPEQPAATMLLPGPPWEVIRFSGENLGAPAPAGARRADFWAATDDGPFGPVVWAYYLPDVDYRRVGDPGGTYRDQTLSDSRQVRIRDDSRPAGVLMVFEAPGGAAVAIGLDVSDDDVLSIIEALVIEDDGVLWQGNTLPQGLSPVEFDPQSPIITSVSLRRSDTEQIEVTLFPAGWWQEVLNARTAHPDGTRAMSPTFDLGYAYGYGETSRDDPGAVFQHQGQIYAMRMTRWDPADPYATDADVIEILQTMIEYDVQELAGRLGLESRAETYAAWLAATPLPDSADLEWLLDGPPLNPVEEAFFAHQVFACSWAAEWVETGDRTAIDQLANQSSWPTAIRAQERLGGTPGDFANNALPATPGFFPGIRSEQLSPGETPAARVNPAVLQNCSFLLPDLPNAGE